MREASVEATIVAEAAGETLRRTQTLSENPERPVMPQETNYRDKMTRTDPNNKINDMSRSVTKHRDGRSPGHPWDKSRYTNP